MLEPLKDRPLERLLDRKDLRDLGVKYSRVHLLRLIRAKQFPAPIKIGTNRNAWLASEVQVWLEARIAARDAA